MIKRHLTVFASDAIARDRTKFTPRALVAALQQSSRGGSPTFMSHDMHLPVGWNQATALYFEPGLARLCGYVEFATDMAQSEQLGRAVRAWYAGQLDKWESDVERLAFLTAPATIGAADVVVAECIAMFNPGIARRLVPKIFALEDDDGLVNVADLERVGPGVYRAGELALFAHHYLRRSLSPLNSLNAPFLSEFEALDQALRPRIALDPDLVGLVATRRTVLEHQYWWGPKFDNDLAGIPTGVARHDATERERLLYGISRTEFWWQSRKGEHIFEMEEVRDRETFGNGNATFGCRYVHAIVPESSGSPCHFDGAVRTYSDERMLERLDQALPAVQRDLPYRKLWRIDGDIPVATWKRLLSDYYRDNHLVGEYLGAPSEARVGEIPEGKRGADLHAQAIAEPPSASVESLPDVSTPRVTVSLHPLRAVTGEREVIPVHRMQTTNGWQPCVESQTLNLVKQLRRNGRQIEFNDEVAIISPDDHYYNLAPIWHQSLAAVPATVEAIQQLLAAWIDRGLDSLVSFALGVPADDRDVLLSVGGAAEHVMRVLTKWSTHVQPRMPDPQDLSEAISEILEEWPATEDAPALLATPARVGLIEFARVYLDPQEFTPFIPESGGGMAVELFIDRERRPWVASGLESGRLAPRLAWRNGRDLCQRCRQLYRTCPCSVWMDDDCSIIVAGEPVYAFVTDRPA